MLAVLIALVAFCCGGWVFTRLVLRYTGGEVAEMYRTDGASAGIFDQIPPQDREAAAVVAQEGLLEDITLPEDRVVERIHTDELPPSSMMLKDLSEIAAVAPKTQKQLMLPEDIKQPGGVEIDLTGTETAGVNMPAQAAALPDIKESKITMLKVPVRYFLIKNTAAYKDFKTRALGEYPAADFSKDMILGLESENNFPDKVFELVSADLQDGKLIVSYRVNVLGLDKKLNSHSVLVLPKTEAEIELKQVL